MLSTLKAAAFATTIAGFSLAAYAAPLATWTFETTPPSGTGQANGPYLADSGLLAGTSNANGFHASEATTWSNPSGNGSLESWSSNNWAIGDYYQFATSTTGFEDIIVTFDQTRSSTGPPSTPPKSFCRSLGLGWRVAFANQSFASNTSFRK